jgi:Ca2+-binding EF-hand superfamily protein
MVAFKIIGRHISLEEAKAYVRQVDQNGDGRLDRNEFSNLMLK